MPQPTPSPFLLDGPETYRPRDPLGSPSRVRSSRSGETRTVRPDSSASHRSRKWVGPLVGVLLALTSAGSALAQASRGDTLVHVLAGDVHTTFVTRDLDVVSSEARSISTGQMVAVPEDPMALRHRVVWVVSQGKRTRIQVVNGVTQDVKTWDVASGRRLPEAYDLDVPGILLGRGRRTKVWQSQTSSPSQGTSISPAPAPQSFSSSEWDPNPQGAAPANPAPASRPSSSSEAYGGSGGDDLFSGGSEAGFGVGASAPEGAYVGATQNASNVLGEDLGGLVTQNEQPAEKLEFHGYVETLLMSGGDGPSPHVLENGLAGNKALEVREGVFNFEARLAKDLKYFGQIRGVRFNNFDWRINMVRIGDPTRAHWTVGRQVNPFGTFPARNLSDQNPVYGYPLPYFYRSSQTPNALSQSNAQVLAARGSGGGGAGVAQAGPALYQTYGLFHLPVGKKGKVILGLQNGPQGSTENFTRNDDLGFFGRAAWAPHPSWNLGVSFSQAGYLDQNATGVTGTRAPEDFDETLWGVDIGYAIGKFKLELEGIWSSLDQLPGVGSGGELDTFGWYAEGKYAWDPTWFAAFRYSELNFEDIANPTGGTTPWDFDADRLELGLGYRPNVHLLYKMSYQMNDTETNPDPDDDTFVFQLIGIF